MKTWSGGKLGGSAHNIDDKEKRMIQRFLSGKDVLLDQKLVKWEILSTISHQIMLNNIGILTDEELRKILEELLTMYENGIELNEDLEDVHANIEAKLIEKLGETGKKVHTATSRNEKILVDLKLYSKSEIIHICELALKLVKTIMETAENHKFSIMPGYTHHQQAMPYTFGSFLMSHFYSLSDDLDLLKSVGNIIDKNPLGAAAGFGVPLELDRHVTTELLGFAIAQENSLATINNRGKDEAMIAYACNQIMLDLGKLAEDLIVFSMKELDFIELPDAYCTGSSIMPQKKNPDVLELIKGKGAKTTGNLVQIITAAKNLPSGYNRDLQETKGALMDSIDTTKECLSMMTGMIGKIKVHEDVMKNKIGNEIFSTHYALSMVEKGKPYKEAYKIVGDEIRNGREIPFMEAKPDFGMNYKELLKNKEMEITQMKATFENKIKCLISLAKKISSNKSD